MVGLCQSRCLEERCGLPRAAHDKSQWILKIKRKPGLHGKMAVILIVFLTLMCLLWFCNLVTGGRYSLLRFRLSVWHEVLTMNISFLFFPPCTLHTPPNPVLIHKKCQLHMKFLQAFVSVRILLKYRVAQNKRPEVCVTIMARVLNGAKFPLAHL